MEKKMHDIERFNETVELLGGRRAVMEKLGVTPAALSFWCTGKRKLPAERAIQLAQLTGGEVSFMELIPELRNITIK